jgi:hypothetical protein
MQLKKSKLNYLILLFILFITACETEQPLSENEPIESKTKMINPLQVFEGTWQNELDTLQYESWIVLNDSITKGIAYNMSHSIKTIQEMMTIQIGSSASFFATIVKNKNNNLPITFTCINKTDSSFLFENKEHDFPQNVAYIFHNSHHITATIWGNTEKGKRSITFKMKKINTNQ